LKIASIPRLLAVIMKEFIQMRRDKATFAMIVITPLVQLILFGYAINLNPRHLPTAIVGADHSIWSRRILTSMENSSYLNLLNPHQLKRRPVGFCRPVRCSLW